PLPWFVFTPVGAWLGHKLGPHFFPPIFAALGLHHVGPWVELWGPIVLGALAFTVIGVLFSVPVNWLLGRAFAAFNRAFQLSTSPCTAGVARLLRVSAVAVVIYGGLLGLTWWGFTHTPTGFIPEQDKGYLLVNVMLPDAASVGRTTQVVERIEKI